MGSINLIKYGCKKNKKRRNITFVLRN